MKSLFITLLILAGAFLAYDAFLAPPHERLVFEKGPASVRPAAATPVTAPAETTPAPAKQEPAAAAKTPPLTATGFVPPSIPSLEEATQNWTQIPARAFPRSIILKQPVSIKMAAGTGQLAAGTSALALSAAQGVLTVAPSEASTARGQTPVTATDFPDQIRPAYEAWKSHRIQTAREDWEANQKTSAAAVASANQVDAAGKPVANSSGKYELLLESMRTGQVTEIRPSNIRSWGTAHPGTVDGQPGWLIEIDFTATTMFGKFDTQAQAQIRDGKVVRWIYTGSREEVP